MYMSKFKRDKRIRIGSEYFENLGGIRVKI